MKEEQAQTVIGAAEGARRLKRALEGLHEAASEQALVCEGASEKQRLLYLQALSLTLSREERAALQLERDAAGEAARAARRRHQELTDAVRKAEEALKAACDDLVYLALEDPYEE